MKRSSSPFNQSLLQFSMQDPFFRTVGGLILLVIVGIVTSQIVIGVAESKVHAEVSGSVQVTSQIRGDSESTNEHLFVTVFPDQGTPVTAQFRDSWGAGVWNSRDLYAIAKKCDGKNATVKTAGLTFRPFSVVPAVTDITCQQRPLQ